MAENGVKISDNPTLASADYLLALNEGTSGLFTISDLGTLLAGGGVLATAATTNALSARITAVEDQAFAESPIYETTAEGIAATGEGDRFRVENGDAAIAYDIYDHDAGGVATFVTDIPAGSALVTKPTISNALSEYAPQAETARANIGAASVGDVAALDVPLSTWASVALAWTVDEYLRYDTGETVALVGNSYRWARVAVSPGETLRISTTITGANTALGIWYDASGDYLGYFERAPSEGSAVYDAYPVRVPAGAAELGVCTKTPAPPYVLLERGTRNEALASDLAAAMQDLPETRSAVSDNQLVEPVEGPVVGAFLHKSTGVITSNAGYQYAMWEVTEGETLLLSGETDGTATALAVWYGPGDSYLSNSFPVTEANVKEVYVDQEVAVPAGAVKLGMSQKTGAVSYAPSQVKRRTIVTGLAASVAVLRTDLDGLMAQDGGYWSGRSVVWFGNSIPTGKEGRRYPETLAAELGFTLHKETTAGASYRGGLADRVTGGDPYGWTGMDWNTLAWSLGASLAEKEELIADWATWQPLLAADPPATLPAWAEDQMRDTAYDNRLIARHLGANRKDWYVFDNPFNDCNTIKDLTTAGADGGEDRRTYLGTMNFLIRLILEDNPQAKIALVGHFEAQKTGRGDIIVPAQQMVADRWSLPIMPLWERLGWSQEEISVDGSWVQDPVEDGYNWTPGTGVQTYTMLDRILADGTHPHSDLSGAPVRRIADLLGAWMVKELR